MHTSHGPAMRDVKAAKDNPVAVKASRLVRFDTGSNSEAELARCVQAYTCGRAATRRRDDVVSSTGVSSTTVASRDSTAVVTDASANVVTSSRRGRPRLIEAHTAAIQ